MFNKRKSIEQVEESNEFAPKFDQNGLIVVTTVDASNDKILMTGYMNQEALEKTIKTKEAHYFSRSHQAIWHKGATSGYIQKVVEILIDDDQDALYKDNIMAVPKSKISNSRRGMRRAHQSLSNAKIVEDKDSGEMRLAHNVDMTTGMYNGKKIFTPKAEK